jgi:hypothetical protein
VFIISKQQKKLMPKKILYLLTALLIVPISICVYFLDPERLSALGSIVAAGGSLLAVIWFSASLSYQAKQLEEQRQQFAVQFQFLRETTRREALVVAQDILQTAEKSAIEKNGSIASIIQLPIHYMNCVEMKPLLQSIDSDEVLSAFEEWIKKEAAAVCLLQGIKSAAEVYLNSVDVKNIDYTKPVDEFYMIYSPHFSSLPYFQNLASTANLLSEFMVTLGPARAAAKIAFYAASYKSAGSIIKIDRVRADIEKHTANNFPLPKIAEGL